MITYALFFFLVNGAWTPGWQFEGWAPVAVSGGITQCEQAKGDAENANAALKFNPEDWDGIGKVSGTFIKCIQVFYPSDNPA
jgi:hypothetical protein